MNFVDTHCHIHFSDYKLDPDEVIAEAIHSGVTRMICVGCTLEDSVRGVRFAQGRDGVWASIGLHPHEARHYQPYLAMMTKPPTSSSLSVPQGVESSGAPSPYRKYDSVRASDSPAAALESGTPDNPLDQFVALLQGDGGLRFSHTDAGGDFSASSGVKRTNGTVHEQRSRKSASSAVSSNSMSSSARQQVAAMRKIVAVGECGLDYYYNHSPKAAQIQILEFQLELARRHNLPVIFHVREAFDDFWSVFDNFKGLRGVIHSFTADRKELKKAMERNLYIGLNGIMTFTDDREQLEMAKAVPLERLCLETDAPFLTPRPLRGRICTPSHVVLTGKFLADLRQIPVEELALKTTENAISLFKLG